MRKIRRHVEMKQRLEKTWIMIMEEQQKMDEKQREGTAMRKKKGVRKRRIKEVK